MKHLGDITKISGHEAPIVDCVIGGSPCQDLSIAGRRAGLAGERSGLYMEQIRIIKELREQDVQRNLANGRADRPVRPRYMVWENVPGAFSSNKGQDFAAVLEETIRIVEPEAPDLSVPPKGWSNAGAIVGDGWSIAWRTHDAQHWGVPQRRKRISLIADFGGRTAPEILFERQSVPGNLEQSGEERKRPSAGTERSTSYAVRIRGGCEGGGKGALVQEEKSGTLGTGNDQTIFANVQGFDGYNQAVTGNVSKPLTNAATDSDHIPICYSIDEKCANTYTWEEQANTLAARDYKQPQAVMTLASQSYSEIKESDVGAALKAAGGVYGGGSENYAMQKHTVRRLTPLECERLQGFPDGWTDIGEWIDSKGKKHDSSDSARYKALGNSIALPFWRFLCKRISAQYARKATMASLFDGIGGFPLVWEEWNGKGSAVWASEIEEFPIAVTKYHFGEE